LFKIYKCYLKSNQLAKGSSHKQLNPDDQTVRSDKYCTEQNSLGKKSAPLKKDMTDLTQGVFRSADFGRHAINPSTNYTKSPFSKIDPVIDTSLNSLEVGSHHKLQLTKDYGLKDYTLDLDGQMPFDQADNLKQDKELVLAKEDIGSALHKFHQIKQMTNAVKKIIQDNEELEDCTFHPRINPNSGRLMSAEKYRPVVT